ncbi:hypothetical protein Tco_1226245 [Tanacetum coccineum]
MDFYLELVEKTNSSSDEDGQSNSESEDANDLGDDEDLVKEVETDSGLNAHDIHRPCHPTRTEIVPSIRYLRSDQMTRGFKESGRELLGLDGAFMRGQYSGQMLTAVGVDANNGIYPVAYGKRTSTCQHRTGFAHTANEFQLLSIFYGWVAPPAGIETSIYALYADRQHEGKKVDVCYETCKPRIYTANLLQNIHSDLQSAAPKGDKDQDVYTKSTVTSGVSIPVSDTVKAHEALAGPDPDPMEEDHTGSNSGKLHLITDKRVIDDKPESRSGSNVLPWKNYDDTFNFGDQFLHDKPTEDDQEKSKAREESDSTIPDPSHQTETSTPPVIAPFIEHTADLIEKYSVLPGPKSVKNQESKKSPKEIIKAKKEKDEEKQDSTYSIKSTDKVDLEEFDLKTLIADEDAMDKEVADKVKDHKRKHDDDDDDDDEGPSAGSNQALSSTGWQITDTRDAGADSSMHRSDPESEHSEQSSGDLSKQDKGNVSDMEDTDNAHIPKVSTTTWFKPIPESERPATPEPEWTPPPFPPNDFPEPEQNWANAYATTFKVPEENKLQRKTYDMGSFIKWFCRRTGKKKLCKADLEGPAFNLVKAFHKNSVFLQYQMDECHKLLTNKVDMNNPEGHQILRNIYEPLPLGGPPGQVTIQPQFFFNKDLDYLLTADYYFKEDYTIVPKPRAVVYRDRNDQRKLMRLNELHKFSDGTLTRIMGKARDQMVNRSFICSVQKMGMETRMVNQMTREEAKDFITTTRKRLQNQPHKGVKASANSDVMYFFTSAQDGDPSQDDVRLCLGDDLKKAQDHSQRQAGDLP